MPLPPPPPPPSQHELHDFNDDTTPAFDVCAAVYDFSDESDDSAYNSDWND